MHPLFDAIYITYMRKEHSHVIWPKWAITNLESFVSYRSDIYVTDSYVIRKGSSIQADVVERGGALVESMPFDRRIAG